MKYKTEEKLGVQISIVENHFFFGACLFALESIRFKNIGWLKIKIKCGFVKNKHQITFSFRGKRVLKVIEINLVKKTR